MKEREETIEKESIKKQEKEPDVLEYLQKELPPHAVPPFLEGHIVNNMPIYGIDNGATIDGILNRIEGEQPESWSDYFPFQYREKGVERGEAIPPIEKKLPYYYEVQRDVPKEVLRKPEADKPEVDKPEDKTYDYRLITNDYVQSPYMLEKSTLEEAFRPYIERKAKSRARREEEDELTRLDEGVGAAIRQVGL